MECFFCQSEPFDKGSSTFPHKHQGHAVFCVEDFLVYEVKEYESIGAGMYYGLTALYLGHTPREAVKVSCDLCCYVAEPIIEIEFPREEE